MLSWASMGAHCVLSPLPPITSITVIIHLLCASLTFLLCPLCLSRFALLCSGQLLLADRTLANSLSKWLEHVRDSTLSNCLSTQNVWLCTPQSLRGCRVKGHRSDCSRYVTTAVPVTAVYVASQNNLSLESHCR